jgi:hypothetical protein
MCRNSIAFQRPIHLDRLQTQANSAGTFRVFVTTCADAPEQIWRDYNRRADVENRIAELKHDLGADGFCLKKFFATGAAFRAVLLLFNLLSEFQRAAGLPDTSTFNPFRPWRWRCLPRRVHQLL